MRICLDYQAAVAQRAGIGRYTRMLATHLAPLSANIAELALFYLDFSRRAAPPDVPGVAVKTFRLLPGALVQQLWKRLGLPPYDLLAGQADLFHFPNFIIPPLRRGKAVVSVHDLSFARFPECAEAKNRRYLERNLAKSVDRADAIITISHFSAAEIAELYPAARGKVHVTHLGVDSEFKPPAPERVTAVRRKLGLERPYILSVGTIEPRKNFPLLVEGFDALDRDDVDLVIAGMPGWQCAEIFRAFRDARRHRQIRYVEYIPDADLPALYAGAQAFALASRYEGFGFPPLEAMACDVPVAVYPGGSLPEVVGDAALLIDSDEGDAWGEKLAMLLDDEETRQSLRQKGREQVRRYSWENTSRQTWRVYGQVLGEERMGDYTV